MSYLLLFMSILLSVSKVVLCREIAVSSDTMKKAAKINSLVFLVAGIFMAILSIDDFTDGTFLSGFSLLISFLLSASLVSSQLLEIKAMALGSAALTSFIYSLGFLVPIVFGVFIWDERISIYQIFGIIILLFALYLISNPKKTEKTALSWLVVAFIAMFLSGVSAVLQKTHQYSIYTYETKSFLACTLLLASLYSFLFSVFYKRNEENAKIKNNMKIIIIGGILVAFLNFVNTVLTGRLPATIQFPIYHMGSMVLTYLISYFAFKERYKKAQTIGLILGVLSIIIIGIL